MITLTYVVVCATAAIAPGTGVLALLYHSLNYGWQRSLSLIFGMQTGLVVAGVIAGSGIGALVFTSPQWFWFFSLVGGTYLTWYGAMIFKSTLRTPSIPQDTIECVTSNGFWLGLLIALANPKTILFFLAVIPSFIENTVRPWGEIAMLAGTLMVVTLVVHLFYAYSVQVIAPYVGRYLGTMNRMTGLLFMAVGISIAWQAW